MDFQCACAYNLAEAFIVTTDYLHEYADNIGQLNFKGKTLYKEMKLIDTLEKASRRVISDIIDAFLTKHQMWHVLN